MERREFIGVTGSGIFLFFLLGEFPHLIRKGLAEAKSLPQDFNAFLRINEDGRITCFVGKVEMGQGVATSLPQMLCDELDVPLSSLELVMGDTDICPWDQGTWGSLSTRIFGPALRAAGAEARQVLIEMAAEQLKLPVARLVTDQGVILDSQNKAIKIAYGELARGKRIERHLAGKVAVKKASELKLSGKSITRRDARDKVTGAAHYAADIKIPGMLYAKILRPPAHGAKLTEVDLSKVKEVPEAQVVREGDFIAVLHASPEAAESALSKIVARYEKPKSTPDQYTIFDHLLKVAPPGKTVAEGGNLAEGAKDAKSSFEQTYWNDYVAHSPMEPHAAIAHFEGNNLSIWASTQNPFGVQEEVAKVFGLPEKNVRVRVPFIGGGFGGKSNNPQVLEAVRCAKLSGKPVQVAWTRAEEFFCDTYRPAAIVKIKSGIDSQGQIGLWDYEVFWAGDRGAPHFYTIPNHRTVVKGTTRDGDPGTTKSAHPFAVGAWRAPANNTNTFARESQIELMATKAGIDPIEFRLQNLADPKMKRVLKAAADKFGWKKRHLPTNKGTGWGVALGTDAGTWVAMIAEVTVDRKTGAVQVKRVVCAQDMGLVINPEGANIQTEGGIIMGLGYALKEQVRFNGGEILERNFDTYRIPRFSWVPKIESVLIEDPEAAPQGGGEPAIIAVGAAVANAVYDAVGARLYNLPMTPERVLEAIAKSKQKAGA